ncbi:helix-turn-helix domain-containing protein [Pedobacter sp. MW01-1-1]|uniref:helix-turn-helix domain-containing protein n=1 Tax=Pedobacter sp. MW01-1-1 TaxID=3383027 RepID=UPI003FEDFD52
MKYIISIGIFQAIVAATVLWRSGRRNRADDLLIMLLVCIGVHLSIKFFIYNVVTDSEVVKMLNTFIKFGYMPLLYLYTVKIIRPDFIPASRWYVFIPFLIGAVGYFTVISVLSVNPEAGHSLLNKYNAISLWSLIALDIVFCLITLYLSLKKIAKPSAERRLIVQISSISLVICGLCIFCAIFPTVFLHGGNIARSFVYALLVLTSILILMYRYAGLLTLAKEKSTPALAVANPPGLMYDSAMDVSEALKISSSPSLMEEKLQDDEEVFSEERFSFDRRKENLSAEEMLRIVLKLETAMKLEKYYTDSELTLDKLATLVSQNKYHISETLNQFLGKPFYTFVNEYRINHVKSRLDTLSKKDIEVNMLHLAYDAGFNSKSSFNRHFKEMVGQTPSTYFKEISKVEAV